MKQTAVIFILSIAFSTVYADGELYTPPLPVSASADVTCSITNITDKAREVTIEVGGLAQTSTLGPGFSDYLDGPNNCSDGTCPTYCKFSVEANTHGYRASICGQFTTGGVSQGFGCLAAY